MSKTISFHNDTSWSRGHNIRDDRYTSNQEHIDKSLSKQNVIIRDVPVRQAYEEIFGQAVQEYNNRQTRKDRKIDCYYDKIKHDKRKHSVYKCIVQIGDKNDTGNSAELKKQRISADKKKSGDFLTSIRNNDPTKISWSAGLINSFNRNEEIKNTDETRIVVYRPFCKKHLAYTKEIIERPSKWNNIYPDANTQNLIICISGTGSKKGFSVIISDCIQDFQLLFNAQSFPLYIYEKKQSDSQLSLFVDETNTQPKYTRRDAITDGVTGVQKGVWRGSHQKGYILLHLCGIAE
ncbi:MAG: hypothetical protein K2J08_07980 [Ruminococcus sp.]|nr:hypothetical protein [Ruminococcus sp.]